MKDAPVVERELGYWNWVPVGLQPGFLEFSRRRSGAGGLEIDFR